MNLPQDLNTPADFDEFWAVYPRKAGKKAAQKVWMKLKPSPMLGLIIQADLAKRIFSAQWTKQGGQFVPHASTYLNGERWEDEIEAGAVSYSGIDAFVEGSS